MLRDLRYLLAYTLPLAALVALHYRGPLSYAAVVFAFGLIPVLDAWVPQTLGNPDGEESPERSVSRFFDWLLYLNLPIWYGLVGYYLYVVTHAALGPAEIVGLTLSVGIVGGTLGINVAHELGHRSSVVERGIAKALLLPALYTHFFVEHNRGHHKHVATPHDPATSRFGESLYAFWARSMAGGYLGAWRIERERLQRAGRPVWSLRNQMVRFTGYQLAYLTLVGVVFGPVAIPFAVGVGLVAVLLLESTNYIEHYGLLRRRLPNGRYEPVQPIHSWSSEHEIGRIMLYELTRHADHHFRATRKYQQLRYFEQSPELPTGYPAAILLALVPPLWFRVMNPRARHHRELLGGPV